MVCCSVLQCVAVCCSVLQCVEEEEEDASLHLVSGYENGVLQCVSMCQLAPTVDAQPPPLWCSVCAVCLQCVHSVLQCVAVCHSVLQYDSVLQCVEICYSVLKFVVVCCSDLLLHQRHSHPRHLCVAVCCSVLQCVAVRRRMLQVCCSTLQCDIECCSVAQLTHTHLVLQHTHTSYCSTLTPRTAAHTHLSLRVTKLIALPLVCESCPAAMHRTNTTTHCNTLQHT